jgi:hypothetical protein
MNEQSEQLVQRIEEMANESRFPIWLVDPDLGFTGCMRAQGIRMTDGVALVIEAVEFSPSEAVVQPLLTCIATMPLDEWIRPGEAGPFLTEEDLLDMETGMPKAEFGSVTVTGRTRSFELDAERGSLAEKNYPVTDEPTSLIQALTYLVCDELPEDELFSSLAHIQSAFGLDSSARVLFSTTRWEHPGIEIYEGDELAVSRYPDLLEMVDALGSDRPDLALTGTPNTTWRDHV